MKYTAEAKELKFDGRWCIREGQAVAAAPGSRFEVTARGDCVVFEFDMGGNEMPFPHVWIGVDDVKVEAELTARMRVELPEDGAPHRVRVILKNCQERLPRWKQPLCGKVTLRAVYARELLPQEPDLRPRILFVGDSITEGIMTGEDIPEADTGECMTSDADATYAAHLVRMLQVRGSYMGYGGGGVTLEAIGGVPFAADAYPYVFEGEPATEVPDLVSINLGTNDWGAPRETFVMQYRRLLEVIRQTHPQAKILCIVPFIGCRKEEIHEVAAAFSAEHGTPVTVVDTDGWLPREPLHPLRAGHRTAAEKLLPYFQKLLQEKS